MSFLIQAPLDFSISSRPSITPSNPYVNTNFSTSSFVDPSDKTPSLNPSATNAHINNSNRLPQNTTSTIINEKNLKINARLSEGMFGKVYKGTYKIETSNQTIDVAIKELISETSESRQIHKAEAELMHKFDHPHVIKLIGISMNEISFKIVLEYARLGDLEKYLRARPYEIKMGKIVHFCYQIAMAMEYLTSKFMVHRDLAARNVVLVNEDVCKVTDFGLSRPTNNYSYYTHQVTNDSLLPLKWYPPELIGRSELKFNEKTDVWSFGVTCWEATSYGHTPYKNWTTSMIKDFLDNGFRLGWIYFNF